MKKFVGYFSLLVDSADDRTFITVTIPTPKYAVITAHNYLILIERHHLEQFAPLWVHFLGAPSLCAKWE